MALAATSRGTGGDNSAGTTLTLNPSGAIVLGSRLVLALAVDNSAASGGNPLAQVGLVTDDARGKGNTWQRICSAIKTGGASNDGCVVEIWDCFVTERLETTTNITVTLLASTTNKVWTLTEITAAANKMPCLTQFKGSVVGTSTTPSTVTGQSVAVGQLTFGAMAAQQTGAITADSDTTNGSWSTAQTTTIGSGATGMEICTQAKVQATTGSTQTFNQTITSADWGSVIVVYAEGDIDCWTRGTNSASAGGTTFTISPSLTLKARSVAFLAVACDNSGASGVTPVNDSVISDNRGNVWHRLITTTRTGGAANDGTSLVGFVCHLDADLDPSAVITITFTASTAAVIGNLYEVWPAASTNVITVTQAQNASATGSSTTPTTTSAFSVTAGELIVGMISAEQGGTGFADDTDAASGNWVQIGSVGTTGAVGTTTTGQAIATTWKLTTAAASQTFNSTITSADWAAANIVFRATKLWSEYAGVNWASSGVGASTSLVDTVPRFAIPAGSRVVLVVGADNSQSAGGDACDLTSCSDSQGNIYHWLTRVVQSPGGAANDGTNLTIYSGILDKPLSTSDYVRVTWKQSTTSFNTLMFVVGAAPGMVSTLVSDDRVGGAGTAITALAVPANPAADDWVLGAVSAEMSAAVTGGEADTTRGVWRAINNADGSGATGQRLETYIKHVTAAGAQTLNVTLSASSIDYGAAIVCFRASAINTEHAGVALSNTPAITLDCPPEFNFPPGSWAVLAVAVDNSSASGAIPLTSSSVTDSKNNIWTWLTAQNKTGGAANDGISVAIYLAYMQSPLTTADNVTLTLPQSTTNRASHLMLVQPAPGRGIAFVNGDSNSGSSTSPSVATTFTITPDDVVISILGMEFAGTIPNDSDTTNGAWMISGFSPYNRQIGSGDTGLGYGVRLKQAITAAGTQTSNGTVGLSVDWAAVIAGFTTYPVDAPPQAMPPTRRIIVAGDHRAVHRAGRW
jgi:hypothetical protein